MLTYLKSIWNRNCWRLLTCAGGSQPLLPPTEKEVTVFWLHPAAAAAAGMGRGSHGAVKLGRPGTSNLTSGQCLSLSVAFLLPLTPALKNAKLHR